MKKNNTNAPRQTEYLMTRRLCRSKLEIPYCFLASRTTDRYRIYMHDQYIGRFRLLEYSKNRTVYLYDFNISPHLRGKGIGSDVFPCILKYLYLLGYRNVRLQVSDTNTAAFSIYVKNGFHVLESVIISE